MHSYDDRRFGVRVLLSAVTLGVSLAAALPAIGFEAQSPATATTGQPGSPIVVAQATTTPVTFSAEQAERGATRYDRECVECHGDDLGGGLLGGPPLRGVSFFEKFGNGAPASGLFLFMSTAMPPDQPGRFTATAYADLMAHILKLNGFPEGAPLPSDVAALDLLTVDRPTPPAP